MNCVTILGRLTSDTKINQSGKIADNCIAVDRKFKTEDGKKITDFLNVRWFGEKRVEFAKQYMTKGLKILITGSIQCDRYKDKDGNDRQYYYIAVNDTEFAESKNSSSSENPKQEEPKPMPADDGFIEIPKDIEDSLPFS